MPKEIYLAGKANSDNNLIPNFAQELEARGHVITLAWWKLEGILKPYVENLEISDPASQKMIDAIRNSNVFILIQSEDILGALIELGIAIGDKQDHANKDIILVLPERGRQSVFFGNKAVSVVKNLDEIRNKEWY